MAYFEQTKLLDGVVLFQGNVSALGPGTPIDTTSYGSIVFQFNSLTDDSAGGVTAVVEASNDNTNWDIVRVLGTSDLTMTDRMISASDTYSVKTSHKYVRYNVLTMAGTFSMIVMGRSGAGPSAADNLADAFNPDTPLNVKIQNKVGPDGGIMLSDGIPYYMEGNNTFVFNLNGYGTILLHLSAAQIATCTQSIDGTYWSNCFFGQATGTVTTSAPNAAGIWTGPVIGQYLRVVLSGAVVGPTQASIVLKQTPWSNGLINSGLGSLNVTQINSGTIVSPGASGVLAVGGNIAAGAAPTVNPITTGNVDLSGLTRRLLSDASGRAIISAISPLLYTFNGTTHALRNDTTTQNNTIGLNATTGLLPASYAGTGALNVQETSQFEGQNIVELLAQILLELRIMNQQMYELPNTLAYSAATNAPEEFRNDPSIFKQ